jgi:hypothetical protein
MFLGADHLPFEGGEGDFEKKFPALTNWGKNILPHYLVGKKCCKTAWLQGSI